MNCTKNEAAPVLRGWYRNGSNPFLVFQASVNTEAIRTRGLVSQVDSDSFLFMSNSCSVAIPFGSTVFEYEVGTKEELIQGTDLKGASAGLRLQLQYR